MEFVRFAAPWALLWNCLTFSGLLAWNHFRVRRLRRIKGIPEESSSIRDPRSMHGLLLEGLAFFVAAFGRRDQPAADWLQLASIALGLTAVWVLFLALRHLGMEWRIKAVVTENHRLVTSGPYSVVRHPVFAALFCLLLAAASLITAPGAAAAAAVIYLFGTEIRVRAEDGLLARRFGSRFAAYKAKTPAYLPFLR